MAGDRTLAVRGGIALLAGRDGSTSSRRRDWVVSVVAGVALLVVWQVVAVTVYGGSKHTALPSPTSIVHRFITDGPSFYASSAWVTIRAAALGWFGGNLLAIVLAMLVLVIPIAEKAVEQLGVTVYCLPIVAIGPVLNVTTSGDVPQIVLAGMSVFFTTLLGALRGLHSAEEASLDLVQAYGGGAISKLTKVRLWASLPSLFAGLRIAGPAAVLGALIGEYLGASAGLGVAMVNAQQALQADRTWALALTATLVAGAAYLAIAVVGKLLMPWAPRTDR